MGSKEFKVDSYNKILNDYWKKWKDSQPKEDKSDKVPELPKGYTIVFPPNAESWLPELPKSKL